jgi:hypothetical protein
MAIADDVAALLDTPGGPQPASLPAAVSQITVMARAYTRGRGFDGAEPNDELAAVIATTAAPLAANGQQSLRRKRVYDVEYEWRSSFGGWTLAALFVLNRYRVRAM